jgi:hypothetical protein
MATTSLYLIPRPPATPGTPEIPADGDTPAVPATPGVPLNNNTVGTFTSVAPTGVTILSRQYGATNDIETVIKLLQGMQPELLAMTGLPVAIRLDLISPD